MKIYACLVSAGLAASIGLAGCNATADPAVIAAAETACSVVETAYGMANVIPLNAVESQSLNAAEGICKATMDGSSLTPQTDTSAIIAAVVMLEPLLANIHIKSAKVSHMKANIARLHGMAHSAGM